MSLPVTHDDIVAAHERIRAYVHRTPVWRCRSLDERAGCEVHLKCENFQKVGAFKIRGATNLIVQLSDEQKRRGVVAHSSGNHAQAVALAARQAGAEATIVMPEGASAIKRRAAEGYGARIVTCEATDAAREQAAARIVEQTGAALVHPFNDPRIVAGQGTVAKELIEEVPGLDVILAPVGGGGLLSGTAVASARARVTAIGSEPEGADDTYRSLRAGARVASHTPVTIADGLRTLIGEIPFAILKHHGVEIARVSEAEIVDAMRYTWERAKLLIEPSAAVPVAALLSGRLPLAGKRVGVILTGGNVDASRFFEALGESSVGA